MSRKKKIWFSVLAAFLLLILWQWDLITYGLTQAKGQLKIITQAEPIEDFLQNPDFPDSLKAKIHWIQAVKAFAEDSLGLKKTDNYTTLYQQDTTTIMWVVTAAPPFELKPYQWHFPILGDFGYKGFFNREKAIAQAQTLKNEGYDVHIRQAGAWSTLGWFQDPIMSPMLEDSRGEIAETIIHELTHTTVYLKDSVDFNENLASFFGEKGAQQFLQLNYGDSNRYLTRYLAALHDHQLLGHFMLQAARQIDSLYQHFPAGMSTESKLREKKALFLKIKTDIQQLPFQRTLYKTRHWQELELNNTYFLSYKRYRGELGELQTQYEKRFHSNLKKMIQYYRKNFRSL